VGRLRHPNIVAAFDFGKHAGRLYFAMELVEGEDAEQLVTRRRHLDEATAWGLIRQTAAGLSHAAREGIVHRDIKPANLLLVNPPEGFPLPAGMPMVKIADFGLAFLTTEVDARTRLTSENATIGSPHYMAPEQLDGDSFDSRVDVYALGATAYHLLSGRPPFDGKKLSQIIASKLTREVEPLRNVASNVSEPASALVSLMMSRDPAARIADYAELMARIDALEEDSDGLADFSVSQPAEPLAATTIIDRHAVTTREISKQGTETVRGLRDRKFPRISRRIAIASGALAMGIGGLAAIFAWPTEPNANSDANTNSPVGRRDMIQGGIEVPLFDGKGMGGGWRPNTGRWSIADGPEGGKVLSGMGGIMYRPLPELGARGEGPMENYRLSFLVWPNRASAVELNFAIEGNTSRDEARYVFRLDPENMQLGYRPGRFQTLEPLTDPIPAPQKDRNESFLVMLERQRTGWWILVDGDVVGALPDRHETHQAMFGLAVERGPAWFSDFFATQLVEPSIASNGQ
jgi:hypothetical protein